MTTVITNIKGLVNTRSTFKLLRGPELAHLPMVHNAYLVIEDGEISDYGEMDDLLHHARSFSESYDASGRFVLPCWCDSHTHLVYAASREGEFVDKIMGASYAEIAAKGGGILQSARRVQQATEDELFALAFTRLHELVALGTGAIEIKSGYGLTVESELKMLRVIQRIKVQADIPVKATFLGAHAFPEIYKEDHQGYINSIINDMLPVIAAERLADFIDVFCEDGFFNTAETEQVCNAGRQYGLIPKIHANQLSLSGGVQAGVQLQAISVDHLETMDDSAISALASSETIGTMLPGAAFFLRMQMPPARQMINANCALALASDFNPGSCPSGNMNLVVALACIQMKMRPEEAINAATINGAFAMNLQNEVGSITPGKRANIILTKPIPSLQYLPYAFGTNLVDKVMVNGRWVTQAEQANPGVL